MSERRVRPLEYVPFPHARTRPLGWKEICLHARLHARVPLVLLLAYKLVSPLIARLDVTKNPWSALIRPTAVSSAKLTPAEPDITVGSVTERGITASAEQAP